MNAMFIYTYIYMHIYVAANTIHIDKYKLLQSHLTPI